MVGSPEGRVAYNRGVDVEQQIRAAAAAYGVPPELAVAVARVESGLNQNARGSSGEVGVFQLMPGTAADLGVNPYDLESNITGGVRYLAQQLARFGVPSVALAAYNAGPGRVASGSVPASTAAYVARVLALLPAENAPAPVRDQMPALTFNDDTGLVAALALGAVSLGLVLFN